MQWRKTSSPRWCVLGKCSFLSPSNLWTVFVWCSPLCQKKSVFYYHVLQKRCIRFTILLNGTLYDFFSSPILSSSLLRAANHSFFFLVSLRDFRIHLQLVSVSVMCWTAFQMGLLKDNNNNNKNCVKLFDVLSFFPRVKVYALHIHICIHQAVSFLSAVYHGLFRRVG